MHVYDVQNGGRGVETHAAGTGKRVGVGGGVLVDTGWDFREQMIDFFGEIAGVSFTPGDAEGLFIGNTGESCCCP